MPLSTRRSFTRRTPRGLFDEFIAHDSVSGLESRLAQCHQPAMAGRGSANALNPVGIKDIAGLTGGLAPSRMDPKLTSVPSPVNYADLLRRLRSRR